MSASDEIWILGIQMTKFGKHPDLDTVDLAAEAATGALSDAGVTMADIGVHRGRQPDERECRYRTTASEADRPDRHPGVQRGQRVRDRRHRAADRHHGGQGRRGRLRPGRRCREAFRRRTARCGRHRRRRTPTSGRRPAVTARSRRSTGGSAPRPCPASSRRSASSTATSTAARASSCSPRSARRTTPTRR